MTVSKALVEILQERIDQDGVWGDAHDEGHTSQDWDRFVRGRLHFDERGPAPFPSAVVIWRSPNG